MNAHFTNLIARLDHVSERGGKYRAKCPAHDGKSRESLTLTETDDGTILIHCFGGCEVSAVVRALGVELSDLFPPDPKGTPGRRRNQPDWRALARRLSLEWSVVEVALNGLDHDGALHADDRARLRLALERLSAIRGRYFGHG